MKRISTLVVDKTEEVFGFVLEWKEKATTDGGIRVDETSTWVNSPDEKESFFPFVSGVVSICR